MLSRFAPQSFPWVSIADQELWVAEAFNCSQTCSWYGGDKQAAGTASLDEDADVLFASSPDQQSGGEPETFFASDEEASSFGSRNQKKSEDELFYSSDGDERARKRARHAPRQWDSAKFLEKEVCGRALAALLGIGGSTFERIRRGEAACTNDARKPLQKHPTFGFSLRGDTGKVWEEIVMFFYHIYHTSAEVMPTGWHTIKERGAQPLETPFPEDCQNAGANAEELQRLVNSIGRTLNTFATDVDCQMIGPGTFAGPRRCLQHGNRTDLFWEYLAFAESRKVKPASYNTYMRVANSVLGPGLRDGHLRFRKQSEHAQCDYCFQARERIRKAKSKEVKLAEERELVRHRLAQWLDRQCYWAFRSMSQAYFVDLVANGQRLAIFHITSLPMEPLA